MRLSTGLLCCLLIGTQLTGCGGAPADMPEVGTVVGKVTLDGKPLENAKVMFMPEHSRPSGGVTDADGRYELIFNEETKGAAVGMHTVRITLGSAMAPEKLPAKYNTRSELKADVKAGSNEFNFDLKSQ